MRKFMKRFKKLYVPVFLFLCIYIEFGYTSVVAEYLPGAVRCLLLAIAVLPLLVFYKSSSTKSSIVLLLYTTLIIVLNVFRDFAFRDYILFILPILVGYLVATRLPIEQCIKTFCNIILFLAVYSLVFYVPCAILPSLANILPVVGQFQDTSAFIHNAIFTVIINGSQFPRNFGIAWEPGAFALLLCIAVFCSVFCYEVINKKRILIYSIAIITTFSTMGYIVLALISVSFFMLHGKSNISLIVISLFIVIGALQIPFMQDLTFGKLEGFSIRNGSESETTMARVNAIIYPGIAFLSNPLAGVGYSEFGFINKNMCNEVATNTVVNWFAIFGLSLGLPFLLFYLRTICKFVKGKIHWLFVLILLLGAILLVSTESLLRISLIYVVIFIGTLQIHNDVKIIENG